MAFQLPELKAKLKLDWSDLEAAGVKAAAVGAVLKRELDSGSLDKLDASGKKLATTVGDVEKRVNLAGEASVKFGKDGELASLRVSSAAAKTGEEFNKLADRAKEYAFSIAKSMGEGTEATIKLGEDGEASLSNVGKQIQALGIASTNTAGSLAGMGPVGIVAIGVLAELGATAVAVAAPFLIAGAAVATLATAFTVGLGGALTVMTGGLALFGGLGAASVLLAERTGNLATPLQNLQNHLSKVADRLGHDVTPIAKAFLGFLDPLIDKVGTLGERLFTWLGEDMGKRVQAGLGVANTFLSQLFAAMDRMGPVVGKFFDAWLQRAPEFEGLFAKMLGVGVGAISGLLTNVGRLSDWFFKEAPKLGPIMQQVMDKAGQAVQALGQKAGELVNWFVAHWPEITHTVQDLMPVVERAGNFIQWLAERFYNVMQVVELNIAVIGRIRTALDALATSNFNPIRAIGDVFNALGTAAQDAANKIGGVLLTLSRLPGAGDLTSIGANLVSLPGDYRAAVPHQSGGPVVPGRVYTVGEAGPETLVMGRNGAGYVIPNQGGGRRAAGDIHIHMEGATFTSAELARAIARDMGRELHWASLTGGW